MKCISLLLTALAFFAPLSVRADEMKLRCTADTNLSSYEGERDFNYGQTPKLRLKGIQMFALFQFDTAPVKNWKISKATLYVRYSHADRKLRTVGISTIAAPWQEGTGLEERKAGEVCFNGREQGKVSWAGPSTDFTDVSFTAGHTLMRYADVVPQADDWLAIPVDAKLVQALVAGVSYGLALTDEKGQTSANNDIYSREQNNSQPYLVVEGAAVPATPPHPVTNLQAAPDSHHADFTTGAIQLTFTAPADAFAYTVIYSGKEHPNEGHMLSRHIAQPGQKHTVTLYSLPPGRPEDIYVTTIGATGELSSIAEVTGKASPAKIKPALLPHPPLLFPPNITNLPPYSDLLRVWAYPDTEKADPITGKLLEDTPNGDAPRYAIWDGQAAHLFAARNEFVAFHLLIKAMKPTLKQVMVTASEPFTAVNGGASWKPLVNLYRDWYVKDGSWYPEACIPLTAPFDIPAVDNAVPGQRNQSVFVELLIPRDAAPGEYRSAVTIKADGIAAIKIPIALTVNALTLPDNLSFDISLNTYGTVGRDFQFDDSTAEYRALEREYHRLAHVHRATLATVGYSHSGSVSTNYAPPLEGNNASLHVKDWSAWDAQFGPYLDGSAFADLPRKSVPISHIYLPFHEAWPADIRAHYHYTQTVKEYPALIAEHALKAPPIETALDKEFADGFTNVVKDFAAHIKAKGWTRTTFQLYQNDKYYYKDPKTGGKGTSWWLLDEPNHRDDWLALAYFARLFRKGNTVNAPMKFREDISRPQWQRDYLDGIVDLMVVSGELYTKGPLLRELQDTQRVQYWNYGTANAVRRSNLEMEAWAVRAWLAGADGIVPWQSIGSDENYTQPDDTALLLPGKRFGITGPVASLRLKALRRAQQDVEYLVLLAKAHGWDRAQAAEALRGLLPLQAETTQRDANDAGSYQFGALHAADFAAMCRAAAESK